MTDQQHPMNSEQFAAAGYDPKLFTGYYRHMQRIAALGAKPAPGAIWQGTKEPFPLICAAGHACNPNANCVQRGQGICRICSNRGRSVQSEIDFHSFLSKLGATPVYGEWRGAIEPHHVICSAGHDCYPRPNGVKQGAGICRQCARNGSIRAESNFVSQLSEMGAMPLYDTWRGARNPHHVRCSQGHDAFPRPNDVQQGHGICEQCHVNHDALYVVVSRDHVKFGITSGDPRPRLAEHRRNGFRETVALYTNLPEGVARTAERAAIAACDDAGFHPVRGREYFPIAALPVIADIISGHAESVGAVNRVVSWTTVLDSAVWSGEL